MECETSLQGRGSQSEILRNCWVNLVKVTHTIVMWLIERKKRERQIVPTEMIKDSSIVQKNHGTLT